MASLGRVDDRCLRTSRNGAGLTQIVALYVAFPVALFHLDCGSCRSLGCGGLVGPWPPRAPRLITTQGALHLRQLRGGSLSVEPSLDKFTICEPVSSISTVSTDANVLHAYC
jgi:hypothetical protein